MAMTGEVSSRAVPTPARIRPIRPDILDAATRMFSRRGFHGTSMQHIADELGIKKGSLYHHVRGKEDLLYAVHERPLQKLIEGAVTVLSTSGSPTEKLRGVLAVNARVVAEDLEGVNVLLKELHTVRGERWDSLVAKRDLFEQMVCEVLREGVRTGEFRDCDPSLTTKGILAMPAWMSSWYDPTGPLPPTAFADIFSDLVLKGLHGRD